MLEQLLQNEAFVNLVVTVLSIVITAVVLPALRAWFVAQVGDKNLELLTRFVEKLVEAAQQQWGNEDNQTKKQYVLRQAAAFAESLGLKVSESTLHALIEAAVFNLKHWSQPTIKPVVYASSQWSQPSPEEIETIEAGKTLDDFQGVQD